ARKLKAGEVKPADAARDFLGAVREAVAGRVGEGANAGGAVAGAAGEPPVDEGPTFFQRGKPRNLHTERESEGQMTLPGAEHISEAELAQRKADEALKAKAPQKPLDFGLFGDAKDQKELFQGHRGSITFPPGGGKPIMKLLADADASTFLHETGHEFLE